MTRSTTTIWKPQTMAMNKNPIIIHGRVPSKKNSRKAIYTGGRTIMIPSDQYKAWHAGAMTELYGVKPFEKYPVRVEICFFMPDAIRADLTNKAESIMDLLVDGGIIGDDNWNVVPEVLLRCLGIDRKDPRAEITIEKVEIPIQGNV